MRLRGIMAVITALLVCDCPVSADVSAGAGWSGTVSEVHFRNYGANGSAPLVYFYINASTAISLGGTPAQCAQSQGTGGNNIMMVIQDATSAIGRQQVAALMLAYSSGRKVQAYGANVCTISSAGPDLYEISLQP